MTRLTSFIALLALLTTTPAVAENDERLGRFEFGAGIQSLGMMLDAERSPYNLSALESMLFIGDVVGLRVALLGVPILPLTSGISLGVAFKIYSISPDQALYLRSNIGRILVPGADVSTYSYGDAGLRINISRWGIDVGYNFYQREAGNPDNKKSGGINLGILYVFSSRP